MSDLREYISIADILDDLGIAFDQMDDPLKAWEQAIMEMYPHWKAWKTRIEANNIRRQTKRKQKCCICGATQDVTMHHIVPVVFGGDNSTENLAWLCKKHHREVHKNKVYDIDDFLIYIEGRTQNNVNS